MKYICKRNCYVRNPQGVLQYFKAEDVVDYSSGADVPEHFERAGGKKDEPDEREILKGRLRNLKINCPANASIETMRKKICEAEDKN